MRLTNAQRRLLDRIEADGGAIRQVDMTARRTAQLMPSERSAFSNRMGQSPPICQSARNVAPLSARNVGSDSISMMFWTLLA